MAGRHRKPPKFEAATNYIGLIIFWLLLGALVFLVGFMLKEML